RCASLSPPGSANRSADPTRDRSIDWTVDVVFDERRGSGRCSVAAGEGRGRCAGQCLELSDAFLRTKGDDPVASLQLAPGPGSVDPAPPSLDGQHEHPGLGLQLELLEGLPFGP